VKIALIFEKTRIGELFEIEFNERRLSLAITD
jgi:hypothetical protein